jgi:hypothetical protein
MRSTAYNSVFAVRFANPDAFGTSQTGKRLDEIADSLLPSSIVRLKDEKYDEK